MLLTRHLLVRMLPSLGASLILTVALGALGLVAAQVLAAPARPSGGALLELSLLAVPVIAGIAGPLAVLVGLAAGLSIWRREGAWEALQASGVRGRSLLGGLGGLALLVAGLGLGSAHALEPSCRAEARELLRESLRPVPGRLVQLGPLTLRAEEVSDEGFARLFLAAEGVVGTADRGQLDEDGLRLVRARLLAGDTLIEVEELHLPLELPGVRIELVERSDASLRGLVERMDRRGANSGYERSVLLKRSAVPVAMGLLVLAVAPLVLGRRAWMVGGLALLHWGLVRLGDKALALHSAELAAWLPTLLIGVLVGLIWLRWREA
jgi:lipopolysaccharide export LptBFGC system permease protein LptF